MTAPGDRTCPVPRFATRWKPTWRRFAISTAITSSTRWPPLKRRRRRSATCWRAVAPLDLGLPYLVAEVSGVVAGFAYAGLYRSRPAYRYAIEDSVYVADGQTGRGIGSALLGELIAACERGPWRQMVAIVGDSGNSARSRSIAASVSSSGTLRSVGLKFGRWVDTPILQRGLGLGDEAAAGRRIRSSPQVVSWSE